MPAALSGEQRLEILASGTPSSSVRMIAQVLDVPHSTVVDTFRKYEPVAESFRTLKASWLTGMWQSTLIGCLGKLHEGANGGELPAKEAKDWAITAGIATEKLLLLTGQPTAIVANLHEVRVSIPQLVERFSRALSAKPARVVDQVASAEP